MTDILIHNNIKLELIYKSNYLVDKRPCIGCYFKKKYSINCFGVYVKCNTDKVYKEISYIRKIKIKEILK